MQKIKQSSRRAELVAAGRASWRAGQILLLIPSTVTAMRRDRGRAQGLVGCLNTDAW